MATEMSKHFIHTDDLFFIGLGVGAGAAIALSVAAFSKVIETPLDGGQVGATLWAYAMREGQIMGLPLAKGSKAYWYLARVGGLLSYLLLWLATLWGVFMSGQTFKGRFNASILYAMHEFLSILALLFTVIHAAVLLGDNYIGFTALDLLIPFRSPYRPVWVSLGILAFYLSSAIIASFYVRSMIGRRAWRLLHYSTYLAFILALVHGIMSGTDVSLPFVQWMYVLTGQTLVLVTFHRIVMAQHRPKNPASKGASSAATEGGIIG